MKKMQRFNINKEHKLQMQPKTKPTSLIHKCINNEWGIGKTWWCRSDTLSNYATRQTKPNWIGEMCGQLSRAKAKTWLQQKHKISSVFDQNSFDMFVLGCMYARKIMLIKMVQNYRAKARLDKMHLDEKVDW